MDVKKEPGDEILSSENTYHDDYQHEPNKMTPCNANVKLEVFYDEEYHEEKEEDLLIDSKNIKQEHIEEEELVCPNRVVKVTNNASSIKVEQLEMGCSSNANWTQDQEDFHINSTSIELEITYDPSPLKKENVELDGCSNAQKTEDEIPVARNYAPLNALSNCSQVNLPLLLDELKAKKKNSRRQPTVAVANAKRKAPVGKNFACSYCKQIFASLRSLQVHKNDNKETCSGANESLHSFRDKILLDSRKIRSECDTLKKQKVSNLFKCEQCPFTCTMKSSLLEHESKHKIEKQFKCTKCDFESAWRSTFMRHKMKFNHYFKN